MSNELYRDFIDRELTVIDGHLVDIINLLGNVVVLEDVTGNPVSFNTSLSMLLLQCNNLISGYQEGSGTPSPTNIRDFVSVSQAVISRTGKNLWGGAGMLHSFQRLNLSGFSYNDETLSFTASSMSGNKVLISNCFKPNTQYTIIIRGYNSFGNQPNLLVNYTDGSRQYIFFPNSSATKQTAIYTSLEGSTIKSISGLHYGGTTTLYYNECALLEGVKTAEDFVPYTGTDFIITFGQTVYSAILDVLNGKLSITHQLVTFDGSNDEQWAQDGTIGDNRRYVITMEKPYVNRENSTSNYLTFSSGNSGEWGAYNLAQNINFIVKDRNGYFSSVSDFITYLQSNPLQLVYELATPLEIPLTPVPIKSIIGLNNIASNTGDLDIKYLALATDY